MIFVAYVTYKYIIKRVLILIHISILIYYKLMIIDISSQGEVLREGFPSLAHLSIVLL